MPGSYHRRRPDGDSAKESSLERGADRISARRHRQAGPSGIVRLVAPMRPNLCGSPGSWGQALLLLAAQTACSQTAASPASAPPDASGTAGESSKASVSEVQSPEVTCTRIVDLGMTEALDKGEIEATEVPEIRQKELGECVDHLNEMRTKYPSSFALQTDCMVSAETWYGGIECRELRDTQDPNRPDRVRAGGRGCARPRGRGVFQREPCASPRRRPCPRVSQQR